MERGLQSYCNAQWRDMIFLHVGKNVINMDTKKKLRKMYENKQALRNMTNIQMWIDQLIGVGSTLFHLSLKADGLVLYPWMMAFNNIVYLIRLGRPLYK